MAALNWVHVTDIAPELSAVVPGMRAAILEDVDLQVNESAWGARYDLGRKLLAAHLATVFLRGGSAPSGAVASESVGDVSVSYMAGTPPANASDYASTSYGREYSRLVRLLVVRIGMVV